MITCQTRSDDEYLTLVRMTPETKCALCQNEHAEPALTVLADGEKLCPSCLRQLAKSGFDALKKVLARTAFLNRDEAVEAK